MRIFSRGISETTRTVINRVKQSRTAKWMRDTRRPLALLLMICLALPLALMLVGMERTASAQTVSFGGRVDFNVAPAPTSVAIADFNGDGKADIASSGFIDNVSVLLNQTAPGAASPTFSPAVNFATGHFSRCVVTGDFNGDGKPDLVTANLGGLPSVSVLLNTTATGAAVPTFAAHVDFAFAAGTNPNFVAVADFNGDGKPDLVVALEGADMLTVLLNTTATGAATPTFAAAANFPVGDGPDTVVAGDFNGDGLTDIAACNLFDGNVSVLLNTTAPGSPTASFAVPVNFAVGTRPDGLTTGDYNNDGLLDLATVNQQDNTVSVLLNSTAPSAATPSFSSQAVFNVGTQPSAITTADFNRDGRPDLIATSTDGNSVSVILNTSSAGAATPTFQPATVFATDSAPESIAAGDFNGDGRLDFVTGNTTANTVSVLFNTTVVGVNLGFASATNLSAGPTPISIASADFNGDGKPDMVTSNNGNNSISVLLNTTAPGAAIPSFTSATNISSSTAANRVSVGDFNGDGKPDIAVAHNGSSDVSVLINTTLAGSLTPTFAAAVPFSMGSSTFQAVIADFNGDGLPDLAASSPGDSKIYVRLNTTSPGSTTPTFTAATNFNAGTSASGLVAGDFNGDGRADLASVSNISNQISVLCNTTAPGAATPSFAAAGTFSVGGNAKSLTIGDFNGDGRPDIAAAAAGAGISVLLNTTAAGATTFTFAATVTFSVGINPITVTVGDFNMDGRPDLASANFQSTNNNVAVLLNTTTLGSTTPTFAPFVSFNSDFNSTAIAEADFNLDGRPDLAGANQNSNTVSVLLNTSAGPATNLAITQVNGGVNPVLGSPFTVTVRSVDNLGTPFNVLADTGISLSLKTGTGALSGTLTGTITAGTSTATISGVIYNRTEGGVVITATRTSGDALASADSSPFTVDPPNVVYTDPAGVCGGQVACFTTIQVGINTVTAGGTVHVGAGTYVENPTVNKAVSLVGPNSGIAGNGVRNTEAIVQTSGNQNAVFSITANNITIDGLTIDGDDPGVTGNPLFSGDDTNVLYGIRPSGAQNHITVKNNIVKHAFIGFRGDGASQNNLVDSNWFDSIGNFDFGYAVSLRTEYYADVTNNLMTRCWTGVHTNNFNATVGPTTWTMSGNQIHSYSAGLWYSLQYNLATGLTVNNNSFSPEIGSVANNFGMLLSKVQNTVNPSFTNNSISGHDYGIGLFDVPTSNTITFGATNTIGNARLAGVLLTDNLNFNPIGTTNFLAGGPGAASTVNINAMPITFTAKDGIKVDASGATPTSVNVTGASIAGFFGTNGVEVIGSLGSATLTNTQISVFPTGVSITDGSLTDSGGNTIGGSTIGVSMSGTAPSINLNGASSIQGITFSSGTITGSSATTTMTGNWTNNGGTFTPNTSTIAFAGASAQTIGGSSATTFNGLTINNSTGVSLGSNESVNGILTLTSGNLDAGSNTLTIGSSGSISRTSGFVLGNLKKQAVSGSFSFPVGDTNGYMPLGVANAGGGGDFTVKAVTGTGSGLNPSTSLGDFWTLTSSGSVTLDLTFNYIAADVNGDESLYRIIRIEGGTAVTFGISVPGTSYDPVNHKASLTNVSQFSDWTLGESVSPTAVNLDNFKALSDGSGVSLQWQTGFEVNNLGFNVYRQSGAERVQVNPSLIAGSALMFGSDVRLKSGYTYTWQDDSNDKAATYWLEDVDLNGTSTWHGPFGVSSAQVGKITRTRSALLNNLSTSAARQANSVIQREYVADAGQSGSATSVTNGRTPTKASSIPASLQKQWQVAQQPAIKIGINKTGWYRVNALDLMAAGLAANSAPSSLRLFVAGAEVPIKVNSADGLHVDSIEFYGVGLDSATSDTQVYWLTSDAGTGKRINVQLSPGSTNSNGPASFQYTVERKDRSLYFSSLLNGDAENWFGPVVAANPISQSINVHNHDANAVGQAQLEIALQGVTTNVHQITVSLNGQPVNTTTFDGMEHQVLKLSVPESSLIEGDNQITFAAQATGDVSLIDYVRVTYAHTYNADNNALSASVTGMQPVKITGFTSNQIRAIDIANNSQPIELAGTIDGDSGTYSISVDGAKLRNLLVFTPDKILQPASITANQPMSLSNANNGADFVIIASKDFAASVQPLATLRQSQGYQVRVIDVDNVYDEFSYGVHSPTAVKDFLAWTYTHWQRQPQFVMLAGSGTIDPRNYTGDGFMDFVPTKLIDTSSMETASDDWFVDFNNDGKPQMSIGRLPVHTTQEALLVVNKIIAYEQSGAPEGVVLVSDINDGIDFNAANNQIRSAIPSNLSVVSINRDQTDTDAKGVLLDQLNRGGRIVNYAGHGSVNLWRGNLLMDSDMTGLANHGTSPLVVTMTCLNGYFQDPKLASLGESLLKVNNGGAVSVWASSGMTLSGNQTVMNQEFFRQLFGNSNITLGQAIKAAKSATDDNDIRRTWILFGDPTMRIRKQ